jgi:hypothetical protein
MDQATIQLLIVVFMVAFLVWWLNRDLPQAEWLFGDEVAPPEAIGPSA